MERAEFANENPRVCGLQQEHGNEQKDVGPLEEKPVCQKEEHREKDAVLVVLLP